MQINIGSFLSKRANHSPNMEALVVGGLRFNYKELNERANRLANAMKAKGLQPGDRVAYLGLNEAEFMDLYFGLAKLGAILVPVNFRLAPPEVQYIINNCEASELVVGTDFFPVIEAIRDNVSTKSIFALGDTIPEWATSYNAFVAAASPDEPEHVGGGDDTLTILYTSGTTGKPKGAELTHAGYFHEGVNLRATLGDVGNPHAHAPALVPHRRFGARAPLRAVRHDHGFPKGLRPGGVSPTACHGKHLLVRLRSPGAHVPALRAPIRNL